jgi:hypothetical protein
MFWLGGILADVLRLDQLEPARRKTYITAAAARTKISPPTSQCLDRFMVEVSGLSEANPVFIPTVHLLAIQLDLVAVIGSTPASQSSVQQLDMMRGNGQPSLNSRLTFRQSNHAAILGNQQLCISKISRSLSC